MALYGIYGSHEVNDCPLNNIDVAKAVIDIESKDASPLLSKYKIHRIVGQYHSALEHTFVWIFDAEDPHMIQQFLIESGTARFNKARIIPMKELGDVVKSIKNIHGL